MRLSNKQKVQEDEYIFPYHYTDLVSEEYKLVRHINYVSQFNIIKRSLKPFNNQLILDAGCGDGRFCFEMKDENVRMIGIDYSENAIKFAQAFSPRTKFYVQDLKNIRIPSKVDQIVLIDVLEHLIPNDIKKILKRIHNVLKKDGILIISVPTKNIKVSEKHYQHFTENSLKETVKDHFVVKKLIGNSKIGTKKKIFNNLERIALFLLPLRKFRIIKIYFHYFKNYYEKNLLICQPSKGEKLIAVCRKKT